MLKPLLSCQEAQAILSASPNARCIAVVSDDDFNAGHIPGAAQILPSELSTGVKSAPGSLPSTETIEALLQRIGFNPDEETLVYDNAGGSWAGRFIWTLSLFNFNNCALIDGGQSMWQAQKLPLNTAACAITPSRVSLAGLCPNDDFIVDKDAVLASLSDANTLVWDARGEDEYSGEKALAARGGHIPGAVSFNWVRLHDENQCLKPLDEIRQDLRNAGISDEKTLITHCQTHRRSGLTWFVGNKLLGLNIKAYPGSWSEWGNDANTPVETGA